MSDRSAGSAQAQDRSCDLLIVWHSRTGASRQLAHAALAGTRRAEQPPGGRDAQVTAEPARPQAQPAPPMLPRVRLLGCETTDAADLLGARAYLFVCPENLASMTGEMKAFFDRCYYPALDRLAGRAYAVIISAGSDGHGAARQIARIATGWRLRAVAEPMIVNLAAQTPEQILAPKTVPAASLDAAADLAQGLAEAAALGVY
ncbi:MAG: NAD(P)H-dependent oxidoreductase [Burkholderiaceae bacterium]